MYTRSGVVGWTGQAKLLNLPILMRARAESRLGLARLQHEQAHADVRKVCTTMPGWTIAFEIWGSERIW